MNQKWPERWDLLLRYRLIEIIVLWEGRLTTNHLCEAFGIGRQQASKDINNYINAIGPKNLEYDRKLKGYKPTKVFKPILTQGNADEYLHLLHRNQDLNKTFSSLELQTTQTEVIYAPIRDVAPQILRAVVQAIRQRKKVLITYVSMSNESDAKRLISPHTIVFSGVRWHVRAYCDKNQAFRDFVLSRFREAPTITEAASFSVEDDILWHTHVTIKIKPDPRLDKRRKTIIAKDYGMSRGQLKLKLRAPLIQYTLQQLQIDPDVWKGKPNRQQIIIENLEEVEPYLFA